MEFLAIEYQTKNINFGGITQNTHKVIRKGKSPEQFYED